MNDIETRMRELMQSQREEMGYDYGASMQEAWENGMGMYDNDGLLESQKFDSEGVPILDPYVFGEYIYVMARPYAYRFLRKR